MNVAKHVFRLLDEEFDPKVFLVGLSTANKSEVPPAWLELADDFLVNPERFAGVLALARESTKQYKNKIESQNFDDSQWFYLNSLRTATANIHGVSEKTGWTDVFCILAK